MTDFKADLDLVEASLNDLVGAGYLKQSKSAIDGAYCINSSNGYLVLCDKWKVGGNIECHPVKELPEVGQESVKTDGSP